MLGILNFFTTTENKCITTTYNIYVHITIMEFIYHTNSEITKNKLDTLVPCGYDTSNYLATAETTYRCHNDAMDESLGGVA